MGFEKQVKRLLSQREITQRQLAKDLNIGVTTLGNYVRGVREPDLETLRKIALYFNVSADTLLDLPTPQADSKDEAALLSIFRRLTPRGRAVLLEMADVLQKYKEP